MFKLNSNTITRSGEILKPYLVEGSTVYCKNNTGKVVVKTLNDFDFTKNSKTITGGNLLRTTPVKRVASYTKDPIIKENQTTIKAEEPKAAEVVPAIKNVVIDSATVVQTNSTLTPTKTSSTNIADIERRTISIGSNSEKEIQIIIGKQEVSSTIKNAVNYGNVEAGKVINNDDYV